MQAPKSLELKIEASLIDEEQFAALILPLDALGSAEETDIDDATCDRIAWFAIENDEAGVRQKIIDACSAAGITPEKLRFAVLEQQDWESAWQQHWEAMEIGQNLRVRPSFCDAVDDGRIDLVLDPGMAFGTGTHPTTRLCLEAVERVCNDKPPATLLDMGAGSGILAIAALKMGAASALAIDMEPDSVAACETNAAINGVTMQCIVDDTPPKKQFELVVANILAAPLVWMAKDLAACVGDHLILSGLLIEHVDDVAAAYSAEGLTEVRRDSLDEWASVELKRV